MSAKVSPIPEGYSSVTPYLMIRGANQAIAYYQKAFGAVEVVRMDGPGGSVMHAEIKIGNSMIMLADEHPQMGHKSPQALNGTPVIIALYVEDVDATFARAIAAGGKQMRPVENQFYGDRSGALEDPFGHQWNIATHIEDVPPDEMARRAEAFAKQCQGG